MSKFNVPSREEVTASNQAIFDQLNNKLGFVPNLYAYYAKNETALSDYLTFQNRTSTLKAKEKEVINLVVSEFNSCSYCLAAHTAIGKMNGFSEDEIIKIRSVEANFDPQVEALSQFTQSVVEQRGKVSEEAKEQLFAAGYTEAQLIDIVIAIGAKTISNYIHNIADFAIDFPLAKSLETVTS